MYTHTFVRVGPFACPSGEGKITTFTSVDQVKMGPFFNFLGKQTNAIDDASHFVNDLLVAAVFVVNSYRRKIGGPLCCFSHQSKSLKIPWCSKRYMDFGINQPFKKANENYLLGQWSKTIHYFNLYSRKYCKED